MKKRFLPFGFISFIIFSLAGLFIYSTGLADREIDPLNEGSQHKGGDKEYLASMRNNQHTGLLDPKDVVAASQQFEQQTGYKSSNAFTWESLGPDNMGGRTRALIFDSQDASGNTIYAGSTTGGIFKSTNSGSTWSKVNMSNGTACLNVSCMIQGSDGRIYVGTGEGMNTNMYTAYGQFGYEGGFVGQGIFRNNGDNFAQIPGTNPTVNGEVTEFAYINELAVNSERLYAATNTGLKYASLQDIGTWSSDIRYKVDSAIIYRGISIDSIAACDSFEIVNGDLVLYGSEGWETQITGEDTVNVQSVFSNYIAMADQGNCFDVKVSTNGVLYTVLHGKVYVSENGDPTKMVNRSIYPENPDYVRQDNITWTSNVVVTDKSGNVLYQGGSSTEEVIDWHTDYEFNQNLDLAGYPSSLDAGRIEFAVAPSDESVVYAMASKGTNPNRNSLLAIYMSEDNGQTWRIVAPGGSSSLNILGGSYGANNTPFYQGDYTNTLQVFPNNPYRLLAGGVDLWYGEKVNETGYFSWGKKSNSSASASGGIFSPFYLHGDQHVFVFKPTNGNKLYIGNDGGVYLASVSGSDFSFQSINKNYTSTQFYTLDISLKPKEFVGGTQDLGTVYVSGGVATGKNGVDIWRPANFSAAFPEGTDGGSVGFTTLGYRDTGGEEIASPVFYSKGPKPQNQALDARMRRSETLGFDYSLDFVAGSMDDDRFITPMVLWESYDNQNSHVEAVWVADQDYEAGATVTVRSNNYKYPFKHVLEEAVSDGDSLMVKDIVSNKLFIGVEDAVYMSLDAVDFSAAPTWFTISDDGHAGVEGVVQAMGCSADGNYLWVGTTEGKVFRISNIADAYDQNTADVSSTNCIIATTEVMLPGDISQVVTSVSVDPANSNKVLVTLGNYGNQDYIFYCNNGTTDAPTFLSKQGNLPKVPVYSGLLEMDVNSNQALVGTEMGVWATNDISMGEWYYASEEIGRIPVMAIKQRTFYKPKVVLTFEDPGTGNLSYEVYHEIENYKDIFVATHGRGVFKYDVNAVGIEENAMNQPAGQLEMTVYPNPASEVLNVEMNLVDSRDVRIDVYDFAGKLIMSQQTGQLAAGKQNVELSLGTLHEGTYLMQCTAGTSVATMKIIVVK